MQLNKFISAPREFVFQSFTDSKILEQWCYPEGFSLKIPVFDLKENGEYHYVHTNKDGDYHCYGKFLEILPNEKLVTLDEKVVDPSGKTVFENLSGSVYFHDKDSGTEITVIQHGFQNDDQARQCEQGWYECLMNLTEYLARARSSQHPDTGFSAEL